MFPFFLRRSGIAAGVSMYAIDVPTG